MRKIIIAALVLALPLLAASCDNATRGKLHSVAKVVNEVSSSDAASLGSRSSENVEAADGLEIPAPIKGSNEIVLKRVGYTVSYNMQTRQPNWVAWKLTAQRTKATQNAKIISLQTMRTCRHPVPRIATIARRAMTAATCVLLVTTNGGLKPCANRSSSLISVHRRRALTVATGTRWSSRVVVGLSATVLFMWSVAPCSTRRRDVRPSDETRWRCPMRSSRCCSA